MIKPPTGSVDVGSEFPVSVWSWQEMRCASRRWSGRGKCRQRLSNYVIRPITRLRSLAAVIMSKEGTNCQLRSRKSPTCKSHYNTGPSV